MYKDKDELVERCYWNLQGHYETLVLGTPEEHWDECIRVCDGLPVMEGLCKLFKSNRAMITENNHLDHIIETLETRD